MGMGAAPPPPSPMNSYPLSGWNHLVDEIIAATRGPGVQQGFGLLTGGKG
jgi:hypothetical protein